MINETQKRYDFLFIALFSVLGLVGNSYKIEMFFNVDFLFGSIFAVLAVLFFGRWGILAGIVASLYTYVLWNHPYAIIIFSAEIIFVAFFKSKLKNVVIADIVYWVAGGIPIIFITYGMVMGMGRDAVVLIMMKQSVNGIFGAIIASVLYDFIKYLGILRGGKSRMSYQHMIFQVLLLVIVVPMVSYILVNVKNNTRYTEKNMQFNFTSVSSAANAFTEHLLTDSLGTVDVLGETIINHMIKGDNEAHLKAEIEKLLAANPYFAGIGFMNNEYVAEICALKKGSEIEYKSGINFQFAMSNADEYRGLFIYSNVQVLGSGNASKPILYIAKPLYGSDGVKRGYAQAALDFDAYKKALTGMIGETDIEFSLADSKGYILFSTGEKYTEGAIADDRIKKGTGKDLGYGVTLWTPKPASNVSVMTRWRQSVYYHMDKLGGGLPFSLISEMPFNTVVNYMNDSGKKGLGIIFGVIVLAAAVSLVISGRVTAHITYMSEVAKGLPGKISAEDRIYWRDSIFTEANIIRDSFQSMHLQLVDKFNRLQRQAEEQTKLLDNLPMVVFQKDTANKIIRANKAAADKLSVSLEELVNVPLDKFIDGRYYYEQDKMVIESKKPVLGHITRYEFYNGLQMIAKTYRIPLLNELGEVYSVLVIVEDITEELKAGEERQKMLDLLNQQAKMAEMGAMINIILHQWKQPLNVISLINQSLLENIKDGSSTPAQAEEELKQMADNIAFLAQTVVDFSDFFKNNKTVTKFEVQEVFKEVYNLLEKQFLKEDISVVINSTNGFAVSSLRNEFKQVILNLYNNSKDALMTKTTGNREIMVKFRIEDGFGIIRYSDNGGGIDSQLLPEKVFEPYVSTKGSAGSGIGLYICRSIIRENMHGDISAGNDQYGAVFEIRLPLSAE